MFAAWRTRTRPSVPNRRAALRLQLEALEDRLAPHCTLPAVAQGGLPFGIPLVACTADQPAAPTAPAVFTTDIAHLGLDNATQLTIVFHFDGGLSPGMVLQYFDDAGGAWRDRKGVV